MTLILGQSGLEFFRRIIFLSILILYGSFIYLSIILGSLISGYNWHLGLWFGVFFASLITFISAYFFMTLVLRSINNE